MERVAPKAKPRLGRWFSGHQRLRALRRWEKQKRQKPSNLKLQLCQHRKYVAKRADEIIALTEEEKKALRQRGSGKWKAWLPDAAMRCAFSPAHMTLASLARQFRASHAHVGAVKLMVSDVAWALQERCAKDVLRLAGC